MLIIITIIIMIIIIIIIIIVTMIIITIIIINTVMIIIIKIIITIKIIIKEVKYVELSNDTPLCSFNLRVIGSHSFKAISFLKELVRRLALSTGNPMETAYLLQRLSIGLQRFNAVCVLGCCGG